MQDPQQELWDGEIQDFLVDGKLLIFRRGKHNIRVIEVVSDEEWKAFQEALTEA